MAESSGNQETGIKIQDWKGDLHTHSKDEPSNMFPDKIAAEREGSNCGQIALKTLANFHLDKMQNEYLGVTEHARDAGPEKAVPAVTNWFTDLYLNDKKWLKSEFGTENLSEDQKTQLRLKAEVEARKLLFYGDERLEKSLDAIDHLHEKSVFKGVEASIMPDGSLDSPLIAQGKFELVNIAVHPDALPQEAQDITTDPKKYTDLVVKAMEKNPKANIIAHIGWGCPDLNIEALDWKLIGETALKNKVAIEINFYDFLKNTVYSGNKQTGEKGILDLNSYPANDTSWRKDMPDRIHQYFPILFSPKIREQLSPLVKEGLKFTINGDEHILPPSVDSWMANSNHADPTELPFRFWRVLKMVEKEFDQGFKQLGVTKEDIINTYSEEKLREFLKKT